MSAPHETKNKQSVESQEDQGKKSEREHFGKRFKQWRQENNISAYRIAKMTGVHPSFISNIEASRRPMSDSFMRKLASITEFSISYETLRAWKIQSEYAVAEMKEALDNALKEGETGIGFCLKEPLSSGPDSHVPLQLIADAGGIRRVSTGETVRHVNWNGIRQGDQELFSIHICDSSLWPPVPKGAVLLAHKISEPRNGEKYLVEVKGAGKPELKLCELDSSGQSLISVTPNSSSVALSDFSSATFYRVLAYQVDWS